MALKKMGKYDKQRHLRVAHCQLRQCASGAIFVLDELDPSRPCANGYGRVECQVLRCISDACEAFRHLRYFDGVSEDETLSIQEIEKQLRERVHESMRQE